MISNDLVVYTCLFGDNFELPEVEFHNDVTYICFTNRQGICFDDRWTVVTAEPILPTDLPKSSREQKVLAHRWVKDFDRSIYIDSRVKLLGHPNNIWSHMMKSESVIGLFYHSFRNSLSDEFEAVRVSCFDSRFTLGRQFYDYQNLYPEFMESKPLWGGLICRRHLDADCVKAMEKWWVNILAYSRRDQLSLPVALSEIPENKISLVSGEIQASPFHQWPIGKLEKPKNYFYYADEVLAENELESFKDALLQLKSENINLEARLGLVLNSRIWRFTSIYRIAKSFFLKNLSESEFASWVLGIPSRITHVFWHKHLMKSKENLKRSNNIASQLVVLEAKYGGKVSGLLRKQSPLDHRPPSVQAQLNTLGHTGGDRMSSIEHNYAPVYGKHLSALLTSIERTGREATVVEVGILSGIGLAIWSDVFPNQRVIGLDHDLSHFERNLENLRRLGAFAKSTPQVYLFDQFEPNYDLLSELSGGKGFDFVCDDGNHSVVAILNTFSALAPHMVRSAESVYIIEDNLEAGDRIEELFPGIFEIFSYGEVTAVMGWQNYSNLNQRNN